MATNLLDKKVSVVVCVKNSKSTIGSCLNSIIENNPHQLIVVDGKSTDGTENILRDYRQVLTLSDGGKGLAYARLLGVKASTGDYILFIGPDNLMDRGFVDQFVDQIIKSEYDAASVQTRILNPRGFWDMGMDFRWMCLMRKPGPLTVVGTPSLYSRRVFDSVNFSKEVMGPSDDTDLAEKLAGNKFKMGLLPIRVYEQGGWTCKSVFQRFYWYGTGDYYFYKKYSHGWSRGRRLFSLTHPLRQNINFIMHAIWRFKFHLVPFIFFILLARYIGWLTKYIVSDLPRMES